MSVLSATYFHDADAAREELERTLWPVGRVCPRCGGKERITTVRGGRAGLYHCAPCKRQFTVTVGTVFESSYVPLNLWLQAVYLLCSSKKGISSHRLMRTLDVTYKTAWFMTHRIREAMKAGNLPPRSGAGATVEVDETYTVEGFRSVFKRGMRGVYQHCGERHLHRYLAEFDFRYNHLARLGADDRQRVISALTGIVGKRLTYRSPN